MAAVGRRDSFLNNIIIPLWIFLLIIMMSASSSKAITNVLTTGQTLSRLGYPNSEVSLELKPCNVVVLRDDNGQVRWNSSALKQRTISSGGESGSSGGVWPCVLSLTNNGRLVIIYNWGGKRFITPEVNSVVGKYVAVLRPEAELVIYGPAIWAVGVPTEKESNISIRGDSDINNNKMASLMTNLKNIPDIHNALFSGQRLYNGNKIYENGYSFILDDCELILEDSHGSITWQTFTHLYGTNCFASLNHYGRLAIYDGEYDLIWKNELALPPPYGNYTLIMQSNGAATLYGPKVWSSSDVINLGDDLIKMPTDEM